jgi:signal peptidase I
MYARFPVVLALGLGLALALAACGAKETTYRVPSASMEPTLSIGDKVTAKRTDAIHVGDIIVFHPPAGADETPPRCGISTEGYEKARPCSTPTPGRSAVVFIKRVVATGGDTITIRNGHVYRNGQLTADDSITECTPARPLGCWYETPITIPANHYFVLGDNRGESDDSRFWGPVPDSYILGVTGSKKE